MIPKNEPKVTFHLFNVMFQNQMVEIVPEPFLPKFQRRDQLWIYFPWPVGRIKSASYGVLIND
jgi:hypothetical protein